VETIGESRADLSRWSATIHNLLELLSLQLGDGSLQAVRKEGIQVLPGLHFPDRDDNQASALPHFTVLIMITCVTGTSASLAAARSATALAVPLTTSTSSVKFEV
jgi:hypothetical protein